MSLVRPGPIEVAPLFPELLDGLVALLGGLSEEEWRYDTVCAGWSVKDVAAHLLGGELGLLSRRRDGYTPPGAPALASWDELVAFINELNRVWVEAARRLSPRLLVDLLAHAGRQSGAWLASLDAQAEGDVVAWAGAGPAPIWLETAREYTERWHHQRQIRDAVGRPGFSEPRFLAPVIDSFARALPRTFSAVDAEPGESVTLRVLGESGGAWTVVREESAWTLYAGAPDAPAAELALPEDVAWRLFCKGVSRADAERQARVEGDRRLARVALDAVAVIA